MIPILTPLHVQPVKYGNIKQFYSKKKNPKSVHQWVHLLLCQTLLKVKAGYFRYLTPDILLRGNFVKHISSLSEIGLLSD